METSVPFDATVEILIYLFIVLAMFCMGSTTRLNDIRLVLQDRTRITNALIANVLIPPLVAGVLITLFPMSDAVAAVMLLLAFAPGGINAVQFSTKAPGQLALAGAMLFLLSIFGVILALLAKTVILPDGGTAALPTGELAFRVIGLVFAPLIAGVLAQAYAPQFAAKAYKPAMLISTLSFVASVVLSLGVRQDALGATEMPALVAMLLFILILMGTGWILGGPEPEQRQVLAVTTNLRNVGLVYVLVDGCCNGDAHTFVVLAFMALMVPCNLVLTIVCAVARKRRNRLVK